MEFCTNMGHYDSQKSQPCSQAAIRLQRKTWERMLRYRPVYLGDSGEV